MAAVSRCGSSLTQTRRPTPLRHPTPDFHTLLASFSRNISRLEQSAEELSAGGSDIGEEIRKMNEEQKARSRQSSIHSVQRHESDHTSSEDSLSRTGSVGKLLTTDSRAASASGYSIVDVNGAARGGGYSPGAFVTSPVESFRSGSWSHASMPRKSSTTGSSRLAQMVEPVQEGRPLDSPLAPGNASYTPSRQMSHASRASQSSYAKQYDLIANEIEQSLQDVPPPPPKHTAAGSADMNEADHVGNVISPARPRSADTFQEAQFAFKDFDGVHYAPGDEFIELDENGNEVRRISARASSGMLSLDAASVLQGPRQEQHQPRVSYAAPPPGENMVYYPAPVPRMLNLPKRLSQLPSASIQAKRRTQVLGQPPRGVRQSAPWLSQVSISNGAGSQRSGSETASEGPQGQRGMLNERMSIANFNNLPPQLRASVFFEHQTVVQDVEVKHGSAVATLDNILAASATAPVSAFTDHPFAGDVRKTVYTAEYNAPRRSTTSFNTDGADKSSSKRQSSMGKLLRRASGGDDLESAVRPSNKARSSMLVDFNEGNRKMQKRRSQMSLGNGLEHHSEAPIRDTTIAEEPDVSTGLISDARNDGEEEEEEDDDDDDEESADIHRYRPGRRVLNDNEQIIEDFRDAEAEDNIDEGEPVFAPPTTLLAELQVRKLQQKSRNRTAATAFPNGMHSTLLQMDAVDEITRRKRQKHKVALAWEDPYAERPAEEDDNVPLGMLYPGKDGLVNRQVGDGKDWDRPLGLMAKRELEDNEPLSRRKNRLQGLPPDHGRRTMIPSASDLHLAGQPDAPAEEEREDENADETLGQRMRRVKTKDALDTAISDIAPKAGERPLSTFTDEVLGQFGVSDTQEGEGAGKENVRKGNTSNGPTPEAEEETLGQRRARLQREREAAGGSAQNPARPPLKSRNSLGSLLATNPVGLHDLSRTRNHQPAEGTLLHTNAQAQTRQKQALLNTNVRSSSYGLTHPLVEPQMGYTMRSAGLLGQSAGSNTLAGGFAGGMYNNGTGGVRTTTQPLQQGVHSNGSPAVFGMNGTNGYFASPTMGMQFPNAGMMGSQQMGSGMNSFVFPGVSPMAIGVQAGGYMMPYQQQVQPNYHPQMMKLGTYSAAAMGTSLAGFGQEDISLDPRQRAKIDQWRMSVAP